MWFLLFFSSDSICLQSSEIWNQQHKVCGTTVKFIESNESIWSLNHAFVVTNHMEQNPETANAYHSNVSDGSVWTNSKYVLHHYYSEFEDQMFFFSIHALFSLVRIEMTNVFCVRIRATWITKYDFDIGSLCCYYSYFFLLTIKSKLAPNEMVQKWKNVPLNLCTNANASLKTAKLFRFYSFFVRQINDPI